MTGRVMMWAIIGLFLYYLITREILPYLGIGHE